MKLNRRPTPEAAVVEEPLLDLPVEDEDVLEETPSTSDDAFDKISDDTLFGDDLGFSDMDGGGVPAMEKHSDLLKGLTNFDKFIKDKVNGWLGLIWDAKAKEYTVNPNIKPIMNAKCAAWCIDFLKIYTRENNIITNINREDYINIMEDVIEVTWYNLGTRFKEFDIENNGDIHKICVELEHSAELVLMGAEQGRYNALLTETVNRTENVSYQGQPQQGMQGYPMQPLMVEPHGAKKIGFLGSIRNKLLGKT